MSEPYSDPLCPDSLSPLSSVRASLLTASRRADPPRASAGSGDSMGLGFGMCLWGGGVKRVRGVGVPGEVPDIAPKS